MARSRIWCKKGKCRRTHVQCVSDTVTVIVGGRKESGDRGIKRGEEFET